MIKVRQYTSVEEFKEALKEAANRKNTINTMMRAGASKEDFEKAGIRFVQIRNERACSGINQ